MRDFHIIYGFPAEEVNRSVARILREHDLGVVPHFSYSRHGIIRLLDSVSDLSGLVLWHSLPSGVLTPEEIVWLHTEYSVPTVPIVPESWKGTERMEKLYRGGVLLAHYVQGNGADPASAPFIAALLRRGRNHEAAKSAYGITGRVV